MARILIADDDEMDRVFLDSVLAPAGHKLFFAREGESALTAYRDHDIDVVLADLVMPSLGGLELIRELRNQDPGACIVAVSGAGEEKLARARELGAIETLQKPVDPEELLEALERAEEERENMSGPRSAGAL